METYLEMKSRHRAEFESLPICYAFNQKQLDEAKEQLGDAPLATFGFGSVYRKDDEATIVVMLRRHEEEHRKFRQDYKALEDGFLYEMANHEFNINYQGIEDVLRCFDMTEEDLQTNQKLKAAFDSARHRYYESIKED